MTILVTGAAGFIGFHCARALLKRGERVVGVDNLNDYYDVRLKEARIAEIISEPGFTLVRGDVADADCVPKVFAEHGGITRVLHLAAQAGVRHSIEHPEPYVQTNVVGHLHVLEACRRADGFECLVYASSSSVYGDNEKLPFAIEDRVDHPVSLYAATKRSAELISEAYSTLYGIPQTGLRYFTVYGPWGRPDMSAYLFTKAILAGETISVFNKGDMRRDFTFIDDIVAGTLAALDRTPAPGNAIYNLGNHRAEQLMDFIAAVEEACDRKAQIEFTGMQLGDVKETYADIEASRTDLGFEPSTSIAEGVPKFVKWFREYHGV